MHFFAYIDPGSGSLVFQLLLAWLMGMMFFLRRFLLAPFAFLGRLFKRKRSLDE